MASSGSWVAVWAPLAFVACGGGVIADGEAAGGQASASGGQATASGSTGGTEAPAGGTESCVTGDEGCACYPNDTCNGDLVCSRRQCVRLPTGGGGTGGEPSATGGDTTGGRVTGGAGAGGAPAGGASGSVEGGAGGRPVVDGDGGRAEGGSGGSAGGSNGTGGTAASCSSVEPCGGSVVGTWTVGDSCLTRAGALDLSGVGLGCSSAPIIESTVRATGTWTAESNGSYRDELSWTGEEIFTLDAACLEVSGAVTSCARLGGPLLGVSYVQGLEYAAVQCVDDLVAGGCTCTAVIDSRGISGTYRTSDSVVVTTHGLEFSYCVDGNTLTLTPDRWSPTTTTTTTGTVVATRT